MDELTASMKNYIKAIYMLCQTSPMAHTKDIAEYLGVTKASVCYATDFLLKKGLIEKTPYYGVILTPKGQEQAALIIDRHSVIKRYLIQILQVEEHVADGEALGIGHHISDRTLMMMLQKL